MARLELEEPRAEAGMGLNKSKQAMVSGWECLC